MRPKTFGEKKMRSENPLLRGSLAPKRYMSWQAVWTCRVQATLDFGAAFAIFGPVSVLGCDYWAILNMRMATNRHQR